MTRILTILVALLTAFSVTLSAESTRVERKAVAAGNEAYRSKKYTDALNFYKMALRDNPASLVAEFNSGLAQLQLAGATDPAKKERKEELTERSRKCFERVAEHASANPTLAARALFNLGNMAFNAQDFDSAIDFYKRALRIDADYDHARKNLRIAQLKRKKNDKKDDKDNKKDNNKDNKKENKDKNDKQKQQPQNNNNDKQKDKQNPQNQQKPQPQQQQGGISPQAADRILKHSSDKEKQTLRRALYGNQQPRQGSSRKRW